MPARQEGQGFSVSVGGVAHAARLISLTMPSNAREAIETSHQGTATDKEFEGAQLRDPGEWSFVFEYDSVLDPEADYFDDGVTRTWRVTVPLRSGQSTAAHFEFSGFVTGLDRGEVAPESMVRFTTTVKQTGVLTYAPPT